MKSRQFPGGTTSRCDDHSDSNVTNRQADASQSGKRPIRFISNADKKYPFTKTSAETQRQRLVAYLENHIWITQEDAVFCLGILDLSRRICELRKAGYDIVRGQLLGSPPAMYTVVYGLRRQVTPAAFNEPESGDARQYFEKFRRCLSEEGIEIQANHVTQFEAMSIIWFFEDMQHGV